MIIDDNNTTPASLPNAIAVLVLGIISIMLCAAYGIPGLVCGIIALALHRKNKAMYAANPAKFEQSFKLARAGYICAVVGTSLSALYFLIVICIFAFALNIGAFR